MTNPLRLFRSDPMASSCSVRRSLMLAVGGLFLGGYIISRMTRRTCSFAGKVVLITGGSRGLGLVLARQLCAEGARVALLARDPDELASAKEELRRRGGEAFTVSCDLLDQARTEAAVHQVADHFGGLDVVINNAGIIEVGPLDHMKREDFERAMRLHFWAPFDLIMQAIPYFRRRGEGRIVNIASIGGKMAVPHLAPYCASKFALVGLSDAFRAELARDHIHVTTVTPGMMRTGSEVNARFKGNHRAEFTWFSISATLPFASIQAERAAAEIIEACRRGLPSLTIPLAARLPILGNALFPNISGNVMKAINFFLPSPGNRDGDALRSGAELSRSRVSAKRLFVSIELPSSVTQLLTKLDPKMHGVRWIEPENMHLTLGFLGSVWSEAEEALKEHLSAFAWKAFFLPITGLGKFPGKGLPNVLWIGVGTGHPHLFQLHKRVQEAALKAGLEPDLRAFHPHITLARCRDAADGSVRAFLKSHAEFDAGMIQVESFCLNSSRLTPAGSVYTRGA